MQTIQNEFFFLNKIKGVVYKQKVEKQAPCTKQASH